MSCCNRDANDASNDSKQDAAGPDAPGCCGFGGLWSDTAAFWQRRGPFAAPSRSRSRRRSAALHVRVRPWAIVFVVLFLILMAATGLVTFAFSDFDLDADYIRRVTGSFNPCILFDWAPASFVAAALIPLLALALVAQALTVFCVLALLRRPLLLAAAATTTVFGVALSLTLPNAVTTNLYAATGGEAIPASEDLTQTAIDATHLHTFWYVTFLLGNAALNALLFVAVLRTQRPGRMPWWLRALAIFGIGTPVFYSAMMAARIASGGIEADFEPDTWLQHVVVWVSRTFRLGAWHWIPVLVFPFIAPPALGVKIRFQLEEEDMDRDLKKTGRVRPESLIGGAFRLFGALVLAVYVFTDPQAGDTAEPPLVSAFRTSPFRFFLGPIWVAATASLILGLVMVIVRAHLQGRETRWAAVAGVLLVIASLLVLEITVPQLETIAPIAVFYVLALCFMLLTAYARSPVLRMWRVVLYVVAFIALSLLSLVPNVIVGSIANAVFALLLALYGTILPHQAHLYWQFSLLGAPAVDDDEGDDDDDEDDGSRAKDKKSDAEDSSSSSSSDSDSDSDSDSSDSDSDDDHVDAATPSSSSSDSSDSSSDEPAPVQKKKKKQQPSSESTSRRRSSGANRSSASGASASRRRSSGGGGGSGGRSSRSGSRKSRNAA